MRRIRFAIFALLLGLCAAADIAGAGEAEAWSALRAGRHVALMRHADAPGGFGDPPGLPARGLRHPAQPQRQGTRRRAQRSARG